MDQYQSPIVMVFGRRRQFQPCSIVSFSEYGAVFDDSGLNGGFTTDKKLLERASCSRRYTTTTGQNGQVLSGNVEKDMDRKNILCSKSTRKTW